MPSRRPHPQPVEKQGYRHPAVRYALAEFVFTSGRRKVKQKQFVVQSKRIDMGRSICAHGGGFIYFRTPPCPQKTSFVLKATGVDVQPIHMHSPMFFCWRNELKENCCLRKWIDLQSIDMRSPRRLLPFS
jgi:hypothetical protein